MVTTAMPVVLLAVRARVPLPIPGPSRARPRLSRTGRVIGSPWCPVSRPGGRSGDSRADRGWPPTPVLRSIGGHAKSARKGLHGRYYRVCGRAQTTPATARGSGPSGQGGGFGAASDAELGENVGDVHADR